MPDWLQRLSLVLATALAGFLLGPYLTNRWQDHKEDLDRRSALVERISQSVSKFVGAARAESYRKPTTASRFDGAFIDWQVESEAIYTKIAAYTNRAVATEWSDYQYDMIWVYDVFKKSGALTPAHALHRIANYLQRPFNTLNGLLDQPFTDKSRIVNSTYEVDLEELTLQLQIREHAIVSHILH
jgi:hypothetical protein